MNFVAPARDPSFPGSPMHGALAQRLFMDKVFLHCKNFRTAVDVGAHIGLCTDVMAKRFKSVWAFEPTGENYLCLQANIGDRAQLERVALGAFLSYGYTVLPEGGNSGMWYLKEGGEGGVAVMTLDSYELADVDLIKIDTEGFEGCVIEGALDTISQGKPVIVFEDNGNGRKYFGDEWVDPKPLLANLGYQRRARFNKDELWAPCK